MLKLVPEKMLLPLVEIDEKWCEWRSRSVRAYMLQGELEMLLALINSVQPSSMIEFGVNEGRTAIAVLTCFTDIERYVGLDVAFDHQLEIREQQSEVPRNPGHMVANNPRFELVIRDENTDHLALGLFDVAFIDGDHGKQHVLEDYRLAKQMVRPGGIIIFHDYGNPTVEVTETLNDLFQQGADLKHVEGFWLAYEYV